MASRKGSVIKSLVCLQVSKDLQYLMYMIQFFILFLARPLDSGIYGMDRIVSNYDPSRASSSALAPEIEILGILVPALSSICMTLGRANFLFKKVVLQAILS